MDPVISPLSQDTGGSGRPMGGPPEQDSQASAMPGHSPVLDPRHDPRPSLRPGSLPRAASSGSADGSGSGRPPGVVGTLWGAVGRNNPFYLMSAACMLGGCLLLSNSLSWSPIGLYRQLMLLATINLYEFLLLALGLLLVTINHHPLRQRDASQVLGLAAVFMCDAAFLVSELVSTELFLGAVLSSMLFIAGIAKVAVVVRVLRLRVGAGQWGVIGAVLLTLFALPCVLKAVGDTHVTAGHLYAAWWVAGLLWVAHDVASRWGMGEARVGPAAKGRLTPTVLFVIIPWVSLLAHIGILHYVYDHAFTAPHATPMLLVLMLMIARHPVPAGTGVALARRALLVGLPVLAVLVAMPARRDLTWTLPMGGQLTSWMMALSGAYLLSVWVHAPRHLLLAAVAGVLGSTMYILGPTAGQVGGGAAWVWAQVSALASAVWSFVAWMGAGLWRLVPRTPGQWGAAAVTASFLLLGLGAVISFRHRRVPDEIGGSQAPGLAASDPVAG